MAVGRRLIRQVAEVNATRRPEHDRRLRALVLATVLIGVAAVLLTVPTARGEAAAVLVVLPAAFWWSDRRRESANMVAKGVISVLAVLVLVRFFRLLTGITTVDDARLPLTLLFLEIQVLHAFDLPQRRDLMFSLTSSLALVAMALAAGPGPWALVLLGGYATFAAAALHRYGRSANAEWAGHPARRVLVQPRPGTPSPPAVGAAVRRAVGVLAVGALLFTALPQGGENALGGLPISFGQRGGLGRVDAGRIGSLPFGDGGGAGDPAAYFGFADRVDPRSVGELDDTPVLRVRTRWPRPLRGVVFDTYVDGQWTRSGEEPPPVTGLPVSVPSLTRTPPGRVRVTQTIEVLHDTPNLVYAAADPVEVWTAARSVTPWDDGTLTTSVVMDAGTVYSVVSEIGGPPSGTSAATDAGWSGLDDTALRRWTQLPDSVPGRVRDLAAALRQDAAGPGPHAMAMAVQAWLGEHVRYTLDVGPLPADADPVDQLLFERPRGWCEPIATAMVVLLRAEGVPARFVTGFQPGTRDLLRGTWTIRAQDAHAWVEVLVPGHGWVAYDPTGATTPLLSDDGPGLQVPLAALVGDLFRLVSDHPVRALGALAAGLAVVSATWIVRRRRRAVALRRAGPWARMVALLGDSGLEVDPAHTPREVVALARTAAPHLDPTALEAVGAHEEHRRYATPGPDEAAAHAAVDHLAKTT